MHDCMPVILFKVHFLAKISGSEPFLVKISVS